MGFQSKEEVLAYVGGKVLAFGLTGTGKSTFAGTFPNINLVDSEDGNTYYIESNPNIKGVMRTTSASEVQETFEELEDEESLEGFDTIVVDSGTKLYDNMQSAAYEIVEKRARKQLRKGKDVDTEDLNLAVRDWGHIKRWNQALKTAYIKFSSQGKWIVEVAHQKDITRDATDDEKKKGIDRVKIGEAPDLAKKAEYDFDIVLQLFTEEDKEGNITYFAKVLKDRTSVLKKGEVVENPSFEIWRKKWESTKKYGIKKSVDLSKGIKKDKEIMEIEDDTADEIVTQLKAILKSSSADNQKKIGKKMRDLEVNMKDLLNNDIEALKQVLEFAEALQ
jgi:hypothetical protein